jgi:hypothetical protein
VSLTVEFVVLQEFIIKVDEVPIETRIQVIEVMSRELVALDHPDMKINLAESVWAKFLMTHVEEWKDPAGIGQIFYRTGELFS